MKKLILLALTAVMMAGCTFSDGQDISKKVIRLDSCEYIQYWSGYGCTGIEHKGNCRYCAERRQKELKELVGCIKEGSDDENRD